MDVQGETEPLHLMTASDKIRINSETMVVNDWGLPWDWALREALACIVAASENTN